MTEAAEKPFADPTDRKVNEMLRETFGSEMDPERLATGDRLEAENMSRELEPVEQDIANAIDSRMKWFSTTPRGVTLSNFLSPENCLPIFLREKYPHFLTRCPEKFGSG